MADVGRRRPGDAQAEHGDELIVDRLLERADADRDAVEQRARRRPRSGADLRARKPVRVSGANVRCGGSTCARDGGRNSSAPGAVTCRAATARIRMLSVGRSVRLTRGLKCAGSQQIVVVRVVRAVADREALRDRPLVVRVDRADVARAFRHRGERRGVAAFVAMQAVRHAELVAVRRAASRVT